MELCVLHLKSLQLEPRFDLVAFGVSIAVQQTRINGHSCVTCASEHVCAVWSSFLGFYVCSSFIPVWNQPTHDYPTPSGFRRSSLTRQLLSYSLVHFTHFLSHAVFLSPLSIVQKKKKKNVNVHLSNYSVQGLQSSRQGCILSIEKEGSSGRILPFYISHKVTAAYISFSNENTTNSFLV